MLVAGGIVNKTRNRHGLPSEEASQASVTSSLLLFSM